MSVMFGDQFYPAPPEVIDMMVEPYLGKGYVEYGSKRYTIAMLKGY